jgi:calmodulin-regulated spectrin-associated protein
VGLTEEEAETLAAMKTEALKDDADAAKGFVISFDDDAPKKPKPQLKQRRLSSKKNSLAGQSEMSSDGSNSSRKENVPPELMICIDMNTGGEDSTGSDHRTYSRSRSRGARNGGVDPSAWRSYEPEPLSSDQDSPAIPKFQPDPEIPLENMVALGDHHGGSDHSESEDGVDEGHHGSSPQKWRCVSTVDIGPEGQQSAGLIIGDDLIKAKDPAVISEMAKKKERIMMQSLRRKQQGEENRLRKFEEERRKKRRRSSQG